MFRTMFKTAALGAMILFMTDAGSAAPFVSSQQSAAQVSAADAAPFLGDWTLAMEGPNGPASFGLTIKVEKEKVVADITSETQPAQTITDISKSEKSLVLSYSFDYQGMAVPTVITLTPAAEKEKIAALFDYASGAYQMSGTGTKKDSK